MSLPCCPNLSSSPSLPPRQPSRAHTERPTQLDPSLGASHARSYDKALASCPAPTLLSANSPPHTPLQLSSLFLPSGCVYSLPHLLIGSLNNVNSKVLC